MLTPLTPLHFDAGHDANGNPRRLFLCHAYDTANAETVTTRVHDEGYGGRPADIPAPSLTVRIPAAEYRRIIRYARNTGTYTA